MKRIKVVGLCLVAVFAFSAMVASGAQAATYKTCVAQKHGEFTDSACSVKSAKAHKGKFELAPVAMCVAQKHGEYTDSACSVKSVKAHKGKFEKASKLKFTASSGPAVLETPELGANNIECSASTSKGELTGPKTATFQTHFTGCKFVGIACHSGGPDGNTEPPENILTNTTEAKLLGPGEKTNGGAGGAVPAGQVWNELISIEHTPYQAELECPGAVAARTSGYLAGNETVINTPGPTSTLTFSKTEGESGLITEVASTTAGPWSGPHKSVQNQSSTITFEKVLEVSEL
jgi:hypothetical protein